MALFLMVFDVLGWVLGIGRVFGEVGGEGYVGRRQAMGR